MSTLTLSSIFARCEPEPNTGCWLWAGAAIPSGYGHINVAGKNRGVHSVAYELAHGPIPEQHVVCHRCDTPACCNPDHLWVGTQRENLADARRKGRRPNGTRTHCSRGHEMTEDNVDWDGHKRRCSTCRRENARATYAIKTGRRPGEVSQRKSHCKRGHALTPDNRYATGQCKACARARSRARRA